MIYTIAHTKGGSKKSTTAWHLLHGIIKKYQTKDTKVILVDIDAQKTLTIVNKLRVSESNLEAVTAYQPQNIAELLEIFEKHSKDIIICDTGGFDKDINRVAISKADKVIVPLMATIHDMLGLSMFQSIIKGMNENIKINVLLTGVHHKTSNFENIKEIIQDNPNATLLNSKILSKNSNFKTMEKGLSVYDTKDELCERYDGVIDEIIKP
ncbi:MAG: ParA family protein [Campylobacterales bacterium]|nr:ParA family protein [Campylobacterales bacterium]